MLRPNSDPKMTKGELPEYLVSQKPMDSNIGIDTVLDFVKQMINSVK